MQYLYERWYKKWTKYLKMVAEVLEELRSEAESVSIPFVRKKRKMQLKN